MGELERHASRAQGYRPLIQRALEAATAKVTSVDEVMRSLSGLEEPERGASLLEDVLGGETPAAPGGDAARLTG